MSLILDKINNLIGDAGKIALKNGNISLTEKSLNLFFICDLNIEQDLKDQIIRAIKESIPTSFNAVNVDFEKIIAQKQFVLSEVSKYLSNSHKAIAELISFRADSFEKNGYNVTIKFYVAKSACDYVKANGICQEVEDYLKNCFVDNFICTMQEIEDEEADDEDLKYVPTENDLYQRKKRTFKVDDVTRLFDNDDTNTCVYIADTKNYIGDCYVGGVITRIEERETKTGKPFFILEINDRTGTLSGTLFPTKANYLKVKKLDVNSEIIAHGEFQQRGEYINFTFRSINLCIFPKNFVPQERAHRPCPKEYILIKPKPLEIEEQDNFLEVKTVPECFIGRTFVVFDLETTGKELDDKITEIGAVKLIDGVATEYFSTLVNPEKHIPQEVVDITGITDDMVKDAPKFSEVCADFYKFCYGSTLVAHNIDFDSRFIKKQGEEIDFYFDNPLMDTLALARENIFGVSNYKLNTLCDKFGIKFRHHRAYSDAWATSELFVEIIRIRKSLPF